jgi:gluconokinase
MDVVLGVDMGTTSTKVVAYDVTGRPVAASTRRGAPLLEPEPGHAVQDPALVVQAAVDGIRETAASARASGARILGLSCSSAMHGLIGVDADGRPLTPVLTWADTRATATARRLRAEHPELHRRTGTPLHAMSPLVKLAHLREHDPATVARVARWVGVKELLVHRLTGVWAVDVSVASATGLLALGTGTWLPAALAVAGIDAGRLSPVLPVEHVVAQLTVAAAEDTGLPRATPVVLGAGDGPSANLGVGAPAPGAVACSIGTSGALRMTVDRAGIDEAGRLFCYALTAGRWVVGGAVNNGGVVLQWAGDALAPELTGDREAALLRLAAEVPAGSDGLLMLPSLLGERAPRWTGEGSGAYVGLRRDHGRAHLVRAALEGVCLQLALVLQSIVEAGHAVRTVRATGGFVQGTLWPQLLTDALGVDVGVPAGCEVSCLGAALIGMQTLGLVASADAVAAGLPLERTLYPDPAAASTYAQLLPVFSGLAEALAPAQAALSSLAGGGHPTG